jgi:serine/threonine-protein kinase RIO1
MGENREDLAESQSPDIAVDPQEAGALSSAIPLSADKESSCEEHVRRPSLIERRTLVWQILAASEGADPAPGALTTDNKRSQVSPSSQKAKPSFANIMAEQHEDKVAAQTGSGKNIPLFELEQEQDRIMRLIQESESKEENRHKISLGSAPEEENELLMLAMKESLAEYSKSHNSNKLSFGESDSTFRGADDSDLPEKTPEEIDSAKQDLTETDTNDEVADALLPWFPTPISRSSSYSDSKDCSANNETGNAHVLRRHMSMRNLTRQDTGLKRSDLMHRSESVSHIKTKPSMRPSLADREFSRRTLEVCERTVLDNSDDPHVDAQESRKRLQKAGSFRLKSRTLASQSARSPLHVATPKLEDHLPVDSRALLMEAAKEHLSQREIMEINQALRDADEEHAVSSPQPTARPSCMSRSHPQSTLTSSLSRGRSINLSPSPSAFSPGIRSVSSMPTAASLPPLGPNALCGVPDTLACGNDSALSFLSQDEATAIEAALREADAREEEESLMLAFQIQQEEISNGILRPASRVRTQGNVRTMTRAELERENRGLHGNRPIIGAVSLSAPPRRHPLEMEEQGPTTSQNLARECQDLSLSRHRELPVSQHRGRQDEDEDSAGFRMNMASAPQQWNRRDRNTIVGPNNEVRTKHDTRIEGQSNAQRLALEADEFGVRTHVGNKAFNSFRSNMKQRGTHKGVASHGTGRAGSDAESTKGGAMDPQVRLLISRAINSGLIDKCNGVVKQGKEAMVYHAESGANGGRFDIAVKVFKRIQEFRGRGDYVDGDPRYIGRAFRNAGKREQLEMWAEKEFRNLVRSNRALVPVPTPLHYKDNIVYMRFLGADGWPAPQLRELDLRRGSKRWDALYTQVMEAIRR